MKYKDWLAEWLNSYVKLTAKARTVQRYSEIIKQHLCPRLGDFELDELTLIALQRCVAELTENGNLKTGAGLSPSAVNSIITVLKGSLRTASMIGLAKSGVAEKIIRPKASEKQTLCFTLVEQKKIEQAILKKNKPYLYGVVICLYTGLRIGELLALEWKDVDIAKGLIAVNKTCYYGQNSEGRYVRMVDTPKTASSQRIIPMPKQLIPLLKELQAQRKSSNIIENAGKPISIRTYQRYFEVLLKELQIPHRGFHALRHTFATRAIECGMDVRTLSEILGHKNPTITLNRYAHSLMEHKKTMMNRLGRLYQNDFYNDI